MMLEAEQRLVEQPTIAPMEQSHDHREQIQALVGEPVFMALRARLVPLPRQNIAIDQLRELGGKLGAGDPEIALEVDESAHAKEGLSQDEERPPITEVAHDSGQRIDAFTSEQVVRGVLDVGLFRPLMSTHVL